MNVSGADAMVRMLRLHGVETIFGLCGDTSLPFYDALARDGRIRHILTRDERSASYMADGYARISGKVGVCEGPSGGGATYIVPGVVEANESSIALLAITTDVSVGSRGRFTLTELDQSALFRPLTKWNASIDRAADLPRTVRAAFMQMTTGRPGAAHLSLPFDVQRGDVGESELWADPTLSKFPARRVAPDQAAVAEAAAILAAARQPLFICGGGVITAGAEAELAALAERLAAPVATTISGRGSISDDHPLAVGVVGSNGGTPPTREIVQEADVIVFVGCRAGSVTTERWRYPAPDAVKIVHIDIDPAVIGVNYRTDAAVVGDARLALSALAAALIGSRAEREAVERRVAELRAQKRTAFERLAVSDASPILPERLVAELQGALPRDATIVADAGTPCPYLSAYFHLHETGRRYFSNRAHGALGYSLAAAVGAKIARPNAACVAVMGDGSFGFTSGELETVVRLGLPIVFVVVSNDIYGWIKAGQRHGFDERYFSVDFSHTEHAKVAQAYGVRAWRVDRPEALGSVLREALVADGPALVEVISQPLHKAQAPVSEWIA